MRKLLCLLTLMAFVGTVHAVTIDWNTVTDATTVTTSANTAGTHQFTVATNTKWIASCLLTINTITNFNQGGQKFPALFGVSTANNQNSTRFNATFNNVSGTGPGNIGVVNGTMNESVTAETLTAGKVYELTLSYDGAQTLTFYLDGTTYGTATWAGNANPFLVWGCQQGTGSTNQQLSTGATYTTNIHYVTGKTYDEIVALPEPTVLALLALGVAGLALRRKAA